MKSFIDFLKNDCPPAVKISFTSSDSSGKVPTTLAILNDSLSVTSGAVASSLSREGAGDNIHLSRAEVVKFSEKVTELAYGEEFLTEFSNVVGLPGKSETEEQFVIRAKNVMATLLAKTLGK